MKRKRITMMYSEWKQQAEELFGEDVANWRFVCPVCGHEQAVQDFRKFEEKGAKPDSATMECIGRYMKRRRSALYEKGEGPCDYAAYGLFDFCPILVDMGSGKHVNCFGFAGVNYADENAEKAEEKR